MATVKIILRTNKTNEKGYSPLYLRITKNRKSKFISLGKYISQEDWNASTGKVKKSHPNSARLNAYLSQKEAEAEGISLQLETHSKSINTDTLKTAILGKSSLKFFPYADLYVERLQKTAKIGTLNRA